MTDATQCLQCGVDLPPHFPPGVCPACLLQQGMSPSTLTGAAGEESRGGGSGSRRGWIPPTVEELTPKFPQWEITALLGQGGMGAVYKIRQRELDRWAALKILPDEVASDPNFAERFQREARTLAQLSHQHIVTVYEFGQRDGVFYLLMEFVDGVTLRQAIRAGLVADADAIRLSGQSLPSTTPDEFAAATKSLETPGHISASAALGIVGQICDALQFAHEEGIVHRDIKPENILIDKRGRVKIADFGLAKLLGKQPNFPSLTGTHQIMGTPVYMAPEQMEGTKGVDHRADIFSLGVVFYELLTGELPLGRFAPPSQKYSLDVRLDEIVLRTLEKEPGRRYQQASDVKGDVESIRKSSPRALNATGAVDSKFQEAIERKSLQHSWSRAILHSLIAFLMTGCGFGFVIGIPVFIESHNSHPELAKQPAMLALMVGFNLVGIAVCGYVAFHQARCAWLLLQAIVSVSRLKAEEAVRRLNADFGRQTPLTEEPVRNRPITAQKPPVNEVARSIEKLITAIVCIAIVLAATFWLIVQSNAGLISLQHTLPMALERLGTICVVVAVTTLVWRFLRQPDSDSGLPNEKQRSPKPLGRIVFFSSVIAMGTFAGLVGCVIFLNWLTQSPPFPPPQTATIDPTDSSISAEAQQKAAAQRYVAAAERIRLEQQQLDAVTRDPNEMNAVVQFTADGVTLHPNAFGTGELTAAQRTTLEKILTEIHLAYLKVEAQHSTRVEAEDGITVTIEPFGADLAKLENDLWTAVDTQLPVPVQKMLRQRLPLYADSNTELPYVISADMDSMGGGGSASMMMAPMAMGSGAGSMGGGAGVSGMGIRKVMSTSNLRYQQLLGWKSNQLPYRINVGRQGKWYRWTISQPTWEHFAGGVSRASATFTDLDSGKAPELPSGLRRFWGKPTQVDSTNEGDNSPLDTPEFPPKKDEGIAGGSSLGDALLALDRLRAADKTPWEEVEKRATELLAKHTSPADKGRIHWMAAHVYGQSDIRGHGADVTRHAKEALKFEREPVQRGWLYMYLGNAAGLVEKKEEATRWYLKGSLELLPFNLPDQKPELPSVGKFRGERIGSADGDVDPDHVLAEVQQVAEMKARKEAELICELVDRRNVYIGLLQDLYGREYLPESDATTMLKKLATEVLRDEAAVTRLLQRVWPASIPKPVPTQT